MHNILTALSAISIKIGEVNYSEKQIKNNWIGFEPAQKEEIKKAEEKLNISFPDDYIAFLEITNGFSAANTVEPTFIPVEEVDYLINIDPYLIEVWSSHPELNDTALQLERSILIGGKEEEQYFLLIPPGANQLSWKYWSFSS